MDGMNKFGYEFEEDDLFLEQLKKIGNIKRVDDALEILSNALSKNPEQFEIYAKPNLRIAKTKAYFRDGIYIPPLRVFFIIKETEKCNIVNLKYIETIEYDFDS